MIRLLVIAVISLFLFFFVTAWLSHIFSSNVAAALAAFLMFIVFPALIMKYVWKSYPPISVVEVDPGDPDMEECIRRSRSEVSRFIKGMHESKKEAFVKYIIETEYDTTEHVWGMAHAIEGDSIVVSMVNEPVNDFEKGSEPDPRNKIQLTDIEDWMLVDRQGNCEGGYTHLGLVKIYKKQYGKVPRKYLRDLSNFIDIQESEYS
jgi:uncharacterized protein YegJ (DUF2314 family)